MIDNPKILIFIPTYNERENVERLCMEILNLKMKVDILFLDDNSPDGTGKILDQLSEMYPNVHVVHRPSKLGIGSAHLKGISWAYAYKFTTLITMDSDFTHSPDCIFDLLKHSEENDIVIGSRYLRKNSLEEWNVFRKFLTLAGHLFTKYFLRMDFDATGAFRLYRLNKIPQKVFYKVKSNGYSFFFESLYILLANGFLIKEIPINLPARTYGHSKMTIGDALHSLKYLLHLYLKRIFISRQFIMDTYKLNQKTDEIQDWQRWNEYWEKKSNKQIMIYQLVAAFYRKHIFGPTLNYFVEKHYLPGSQVLHAGCGSGQVDINIKDKVSIIPLDFSTNALNLYKKENNYSNKIIQASTLAIPLSAETLDGIYSLGLLEHLTKEDIHCTLSEFHRVLNLNGKVILFWPPEFGLTTNFLDFVHFILNRILMKNVKLHPDEISRVKSKEQVRTICEQAGFFMEDYYFGIRDFFTQVIIVLKKKESNLCSSHNS